jgi:Tol biopolymer transport system component
LVFRDRLQNGLLWLKRWDQLDPVPIPGTERGFSPVFSPDGEWLAFTADGRVKKIRPGGGAAVTLADSAAPTRYGIAWLDDGTLVYATAAQDELRRVSSAGGASTVALGDSALRGYGLLNPTPLPHSRGVLFLVCTSGCVNMSLHVLDLRTGTHKLLLDDAFEAWYLPLGYLLYVRRDGAALVVRFDLDRLEIDGPAIPVLDRVVTNGSNPMLAWSPAGTLLFLRGDARSSGVEMVRVSREGVATPVDTNWFGDFNSSALSPDGKRLAVGAGLTAGGLSIYIKQLDHGPFSRLTFGGQDRRPAWSPDGRLVAFIRDSGNGGNVYARRTDGSGADTLLARIDRPIQEITWSGDGRWLVVRTDNGAAGAGDLIGIRTNGDSTPVSLVATSFTEMHPAVSRDGHWLAYTSNESGTNEVYVRPFPGASGGRWQVSNGGGAQPVWSPDGRELYFLDGASQLVAAEIRTAPSFEVIGRRPLFDAVRFVLDAFHQSYDVTPDGRAFIFARGRASTRASDLPRPVLVEHWFTDLRGRLPR